MPHEDQRFSYGYTGSFAPMLFGGDLPGCLDRVAAMGYDRYLSMELLPIPNDEDAARRALRYIRNPLAGLNY